MTASASSSVESPICSASSTAIESTYTRRDISPSTRLKATWTITGMRKVVTRFRWPSKRASSYELKPNRNPPASAGSSRLKSRRHSRYAVNAANAGLKTETTLYEKMGPNNAVMGAIKIAAVGTIATFARLTPVGDQR
jgi:hypothetical protein